MRIGFVGLGLMGRPMAHRLIDAGYQLAVFTGNADSLASLTERGATAAGSVAEAADGVEVFCSCRVTAQQSREVFLGSGSVVSASKPASVCVDFATIDPAISRDIGAAMSARGVDYLDAPISGGPGRAETGALSIMIGGESAAVARAQPLFETLGKKIFHMGAIGTGVTTKLCNNMISITTHALIAEAFVLGVKSGIDARALYEALNSSSAHSQTLERVVPRHFLQRDFRPAATIETIMKDLNAAIDLAREQGVRLSLPKVAMQRFVEAAEMGHAQSDIASVILPMEEIAGVTVGPA